MKDASANPFDIRLVFGLVAAGLIAFVGFLALTAYADDFRGGRDGGSHALSVSAVGYKGLVDLIDYDGGETGFLRSADDLEDENLLIVPLNPGTDAKALDALISGRGARPTLLILPKWQVMPHPLRKSWVAGSDPAPAELIETLLPEKLGLKVGQAKAGKARLQGRGFLEDFSLRAPPIVQSLSGEGLETLLAAPNGNAVLARVQARGALYLLADPDLLNNMGLKDKEAAAAALELVYELVPTEGEVVNFDLTLSGFGDKKNMLKLAFEPPFLALTAALLIAALLAGLHGAARFGPAPAEERAIALGKAALVDNSAGLIRLARREHRVGGAYADLVRDAAARVSGADPSLSGEKLEAYLDRIGKPGDRRFTDLAAALRSATDRNALLAAARETFMWKKDISQ